METQLGVLNLNINFKKKWQTLQIETYTDGRGCLSVFQNAADFEIKRIYYLHDVPSDQRRGSHAHKKLNQVIIALHGQCQITLDDGAQTESFLLSNPTLGLKVAHMVWRDMFNFSPDCVLLVLTDREYEASDYIRDYSEFKKILDTNHD